MATPDVVAAHREGRAPLRQVWVIALVVLGVVAVLAGFLVLAAAEGLDFGYFSKEPAETLDVPRFIGWQAHTVVLITMTGAAAALLGWLLVRRLGGDPVAGRFLLGVGLFTVLLVLDDFLQFHEAVYPKLFGVSEIVVYPIYGLIIVSVLWFWGRHVVDQDRIMVAISGLCMATSVGVDRVVSSHDANFHLIEDGTKMLGLTLWTVFLIRTTIRLVLASARAAVATAAPAMAEPAPAGGWTPQSADVQDTVRCTAVRPGRFAAVDPPIPVPRAPLNPVPRHRAVVTHPSGAPRWSAELSEG